MNFSTYANKKSGNINEIKVKLLHALESEIVKDKQDWKLPMIYEAVLQSGGKNFGSRYGLSEEISFADTELMCAYEKGDKCVEYLTYRFDFKYYPQKKKIKDFPLVVAIEASSQCNLRCKMCFQSNMDRHLDGANKGLMSMKVFEKFLYEIETHPLYSIVFASRGEPLLNPNIADMIRLAKQKGVIDIKLNTNATLLTEEMSRKLLESGLDLLVFSIDSIFPKTYYEIRGCNLEKVLRNVDRFLEIKKKEYPQSNLKVRVAMVVTNGLKDKDIEIETAKEYWTSRVDEFSVKSENDFVSVYGLDRVKEYSNPCSLLWERVYLWYNGDVNPCDIDHLSKLKLGNIMEGDSIYSIWHGEKLNTLRQEHKHCRKTAPCIGCTGY